MIFCYKHTDKQTLHHYIYIITRLSKDKATIITTTTTIIMILITRLSIGKATIITTTTITMILITRLSIGKARRIDLSSQCLLSCDTAPQVFPHIKKESTSGEYWRNDIDFFVLSSTSSIEIYPQGGCQGGHVDRAWGFLRHHG